MMMSDYLDFVRAKIIILPKLGLSRDEAMRRAASEWDEEDRARLTGEFRTTFKDGVRAALDGNLGDWLKNWWRDRVAKGMEEALNSLADLIASLFSKAGGAAGGSGGGGIGGIIGSILGSLGGGGWKGSPVDITGPPTGSFDWSLSMADLPAFATGGSFKVGGMSGVDRNLVAFRATKGEMVDIRHGNDNGPSGGVNINMPITFSGAMDLATKAEAIRFADGARLAAMRGIAEAQKRRG